MTAILTYPVIKNMTGAIMGTGDAWQVLYILWYTKQALLGGNPGITMTYTNYIFYPNGVPMIFSSFSLFNQLIGVPLQMLFGLAATYNIVWLLSFILAGYGAFLLVRYLTGNDMAAFVSGIIYTFSPYHFEQAQMHMGATTIEWIPFCALFLMKMFREKSLKSAFLAGLFFILVALSDSQYMMFMAMLVGLLFLFEMYCIFREKSNTRDNVNGIQKLKAVIEKYKKMLIRYAVFAITALVGVIPANYDLLSIAMSGNNFLIQDISDSKTFSGDLLGFFIPSPFHPIFGSLVADVYTNFTGNNAEYITYIGMTVLALSVVAVVTRRKEKEVQFWALSAVFFMLMVLGPVLHIMGSTKNFWTGFNLPMPYALAYNYLPFIKDGRTPDRFDVLVMLSFTVLAGYGLARLMDMAKTPRKGSIIALIAMVLIIFEFMSTPVISLVDTPAFYQQLGQDTGHYAVIEIPASYSYEAGLKSEYYETISDKPMVGGQIPRTPTDAAQFEFDTPLINDITYPPYSDQQLSSYDIFNQNETRVGNCMLESYNISYVILHTDFMANISPGWLAHDMVILNASLNESPTYVGDNLIVYKVPETPPTVYIVPGEGFGLPDTDGNITWRPAENVSSIHIINPYDGNYTLSFDVSSLVPDSLNVSMNGESLVNQQTTGQFTYVDIPVKLQAGDNMVSFNSTTVDDQTLAIPEWMQYTRFMFKNVSVESEDGEP